MTKSDDSLERGHLEALALNYCRASLCKIVSYNDRIVVDEEYSNIINNIDLTKIRDEEITNLIRELADSISPFKLQEGDKERFLGKYERKATTAVYLSLSGADALFYGNGGDPFVLAAMDLVQTGGAYEDYTGNMEDYRKAFGENLWKLEKDAVVGLKDIQKDFLETCWRLMKQHGRPEDWRVTEEQMEHYVNVLKDGDQERKLRELRIIEGDFKTYPPFWYHYGRAAQGRAEVNLALTAYQTIERLHKGLLREDHLYSSALMNRIQLLDDENEEGEIERCLMEIAGNSPQDWRKNIFCAIKFSEYMEYEAATERLITNIENQKNIPLSMRVLGEIYMKQTNVSFLRRQNREALWFKVEQFLGAFD